MDALGTIASCYEYDKNIYEFVDKVKKASKEREEYLLQAKALINSFTSLEKRISGIPLGGPIPDYLKDLIELKPTETPKQPDKDRIKRRGIDK